MLNVQKRVFVELKDLADRNLLSQGYLITGPIFIGKFILIKELAQNILGENFELDYIEVLPKIDKKKKSKTKIISVDDIRRLNERMMQRTVSGHRFIVLNKVEYMTKQAQNAFLKVLEEPNPGNHIFLITSDEGALLPTIKSRVISYNLPVVDLNDWPKDLKSQYEDLTEQEKVIAKNRPGLLIELNGENRDIIKMQIKQAIDLVEGKVYERFSFVDKISKNNEREDLRDILRLALIYARNMNYSYEVQKSIVYAEGLLSSNLNKKLLLSKVALTK